MANNYKEIERDFDWFYNVQDAALGINSNCLSLSSATFSQSDPEAAMSCVDPIARRRSRLLYQLRAAMPRRLLAALDACYNPPSPYPEQFVKLFGKKTGCLYYVALANNPELIVRLTDKKLKSELNPEETIQSFELVDQVNKLWHAAHQTYLFTKQTIVNGNPNLQIGKR